MRTYDSIKRLRQSFIEQNAKEPDRVILTPEKHAELCREFQSIGRSGCTSVAEVMGMAVRVTYSDMPESIEVR